MQDTYNLGWKLASVIQGVAHPNLLRTYHQERLPVAKRLIDFDRRVCRGMLEANNTFDDDHRKALVEENTSMSGLGVTYEPNMVIAQPIPGQKVQPTINGHSKLPSQPDPVKAIKLGARMPCELVLSQSDSQPHQMQQIFPSTGEWNLVVFGGNVVDQIQKRQVENLAAALSSPKSVVQKIRHRGQSNGNRLIGGLSIYLVHSASCTDVNIWDLPDIFRPPDEDTGIDYGKVFADNKSYHAGGGNAYYNYGVSSQGCIVLLRPDQHVAFMGGLGDTGGLERFLESANAGVL